MRSVRQDPARSGGIPEKIMSDSPAILALTRRIASGAPVFLFFSGSWCDACRAMKPLFLEAARTHAGEAEFAVADIEEASYLAADCGVSSLSAIVFFRDGDDMDMLAGRFSRGELEAFISRMLP